MTWYLVKRRDNFTLIFKDNQLRFRLERPSPVIIWGSSNCSTGFWRLTAPHSKKTAYYEMLHWASDLDTFFESRKGKIHSEDIDIDGKN
jgi:hypothetical protein